MITILKKNNKHKQTNREDNMSKKDKLKKYSVTVSKTISVLASDEYEAEEQARADFDCTDLDCEVHDE
jgi:hypothetical protein